MVTLTDLLFKIMLPIMGLAIGMGIGLDHFHWYGAIVGALLGLYLFSYIGSFLDRIYVLSVFRAMHRKWASFSTNELRNQLPTSFTPNFLLIELRQRGEDISGDVAPILDLLQANESFKRIRGWAAVLSAFPQLTASLRGYNPTHSVSECQKKIVDFRQQFETFQSLHRE